MVELDGADGVPAAVVLEHLLEEGRGRELVAPVEEDEGGAEGLAEEGLPVGEGVQVVAGDPGLEAADGGAAEFYGRGGRWCGRGCEEIGGAAAFASRGRGRFGLVDAAGEASALDFGEVVEGLAVEHEVEGF